MKKNNARFKKLLPLIFASIGWWVFSCIGTIALAIGIGDYGGHSFEPISVIIFALFAPVTFAYYLSSELMRKLNHRRSLPAFGNNNRFNYFIY